MMLLDLSEDIELDSRGCKHGFAPTSISIIMSRASLQKQMLYTGLLRTRINERGLKWA